MSYDIPQTRPLLYRSGGYQIEHAVADPSVTLIETGDEFGFLLSESAEDSNLYDRLLLENVLWAKGTIADGFFKGLMGDHELMRRPFDRVELFRHDAGFFVAQDSETQLYLPEPSAEPYVVVFNSMEEYETLREGIEQEEIDDVMQAMALVLEGVPGFSVDGDVLIGPETYAQGVRVELDRPVMRM